MFHQRFLEAPYEDDGEIEAFEEWADKEWGELGVTYKGETLYCDSESIFYVSDVSWVSGGEESEWDYKKHYLDQEDLVKIIVDNL